MEDKRKVAFVLTDEALRILDERSTPRKRGELLSRLIVAWGAKQEREQSGGILERIEQRLERMEQRQLAGAG